MEDKRDRGLFIAFEGIDGSGKSTQIQLLCRRLFAEGISYYTTMEPTDSPIGSLIHQIMTGRLRADIRVTAELFTADRLDHLLNDVDGILAKILTGTTVITDRYYFSSFAYQSTGLPMDSLIRANEPCMELLRPTVSFFIDVDPDTAMERIARTRFHRELYEKRSILEKVRENYLKAFDRLKDQEQIVTVDGNRPQREIAEDIWEHVRRYIRT